MGIIYMMLSTIMINKEDHNTSLDESKDNQNISVVGAEDMPLLSNIKRSHKE